MNDRFDKVPFIMGQIYNDDYCSHEAIL